MRQSLQEHFDSTGDITHAQNVGLCAAITRVTTLLKTSPQLDRLHGRHEARAELAEAGQGKGRHANNFFVRVMTFVISRPRPKPSSAVSR